MFASFPYWYASLFSGYYLILLLILVGLINAVFPLSFAQMPEDRKNMWNWTLTIGSTLVPLCSDSCLQVWSKACQLMQRGNMSALR